MGINITNELHKLSQLDMSMPTRARLSSHLCTYKGKVSNSSKAF